MEVRHCVCPLAVVRLLLCARPSSLYPTVDADAKCVFCQVKGMETSAAVQEAVAGAAAKPSAVVKTEPDATAAAGADEATAMEGSEAAAAEVKDQTAVSDGGAAVGSLATLSTSSK